MAKTTTKSKATKSTKSPKTVKVSTLVIAVAVLLGLIASFIGGIVYANSYNDTVNAKAMERVKEIELKLNQ